MRAFAEVAGQELLWVQPAARKRQFELRAGDEVVATLRFQRSSLADAEAADHHWTFKREGFWHPRVTVRVSGSETDVALFHPSWMGGGTLELPQGKSLKLASANIWQSEWVWQEVKDVPLVRFKGRHGLLKASAQVEIGPDAAHRDDLPLLVLLGWYLILLYSQDAAAASAATVVAITPALG
jgi:hypothetical protein